MENLELTILMAFEYTEKALFEPAILMEYKDTEAVLLELAMEYEDTEAALFGRVDLRTPPSTEGD
jgi:hypothetical protein